ncbi:hypothetical protein M2H12_21890, partial [Vibrio vulnificus]|nr:hypothetical protein [Vibrio vulnificus]MCU8172892.1 hypothetical protein [Vibrio vulnificus]
DHLAKIKDGSTTAASKTVNLNASGEATLTLVAPKGGLKSTINITSGSKSATEHVTFSTITSPDTPLANRYGFMTNYINGNAEGTRRYHRPILLEDARKLPLPSGLTLRSTGPILNEEYLRTISAGENQLWCKSLGGFTPNLTQTQFARESTTSPKTILNEHGWAPIGYLNQSSPVTPNYHLVLDPRNRNPAPGTLDLLFVGQHNSNALAGAFSDQAAYCMYDITVSTVKNAHTFAVDSGFPTTAFNGAQFKLNMYGDNTGYSFVSSDTINAPVDSDGVVTMRGKPTGEVTITASKDGEADFEYKFTIQLFFNGLLPGSNTPLGPHGASQVCINSNYQVPTREMLSNGHSGSRSVGALLNEWGSMLSWGWRVLYQPGSSSILWLNTSSRNGNLILSVRPESQLFNGVQYIIGEWVTADANNPSTYLYPYCYR